MTSTTETIALAQWLTDPPNRFYRYPFVKFFFRPLFYTPLTPNQVSFFHTLIGLGAIYFLVQGTYLGLLWALLFYEFRSLLDCFDGVLARWKNMSSVFGRHIDEISDVISVIGLLIGSGFYFQKTSPEEPFIGLILGVAFTLFMMGNVYDFYRRKLGAVLVSGKDQFIGDLESAALKLKENNSLFNKAGYSLDLWRCRFFTPETYREFMAGSVNSNQREIQTVLSLAQSSPEKLKPLLIVCSLSTGDLGLFILHMGLLSGYLYEFFYVTLFFGWFVLILSMGMFFLFYRNLSKNALELKKC